MAVSDEPPAASAGASALQRARAALEHGDHRDGLGAAMQAREQARVDADARALAAAQLIAARHLARLGRFDDAAGTAQEAVRQWHALADAAGECEALCTLSEARIELGHDEDALHSAADACDLARRHGLASLAPEALARLGVCQHRMGDPSQGEQHLLASLEQARELRSAEATLLALDQLALAAIEAWRRAQRRGGTGSAPEVLQGARDHASQAHALAERLHDPARVAATGAHLAELLVPLGEFDDARRLIDVALDRARADGLRAVELGARSALAEWHAARGEAQLACDEAVALLDDLRRDGDHEPTRLRAHATLWAGARQLGRFDMALTHCEACYAIDLQRAASHAEVLARLQAQAAGSAPAPAAAAAPLGGPDDHDIERELRPLFDQVRFRRKPLALATIEVDGLNAMRTRAGAAAAQAALREIGSLMRQRLRGRDLALRRGADAFLLVLGDTPPAAAQAICERVRSAVHHHDWSRMSLGAPLTLSMGLVNVVAGREPAAELARADAALRSARTAGGNRVQTAAA